MISESLTKIVEHLRGQKTLPVRLTTIYEWIKQEGLQDEIRFFEAPLPSSVSRGFFRQFEAVSPTAKPSKYSRILVSDQEDKILRRFVLCKEMSHVFEPPESSNILLYIPPPSSNGQSKIAFC